MSDDPKFSKPFPAGKPRSLEDAVAQDKGKAADAMRNAQNPTTKQSNVARNDRNIAEPRPGMQPKPPRGSAAVDRQAHQDRLNKQDRLAKSKLDKAQSANKSVKVRKDKQNSVELNKGNKNKGIEK